MPEGTGRRGRARQPDLPRSLARLRWRLVAQQLSSAARVSSELRGPWLRRVPNSKSQPCSCQGPLPTAWPLSGGSRRQGGFYWHTLGQEWPQRPSLGWIIPTANMIQSSPLCLVLLRIASGYRAGWVRADENATGLRRKAKTRSAK